MWQGQGEWRGVITLNLLRHHLEVGRVEGLEVLELVTISISLGEVKDQIPSVAVRVQLGSDHVLIQMRITQIVRAKSESLAGFDDGVTGTIQVNL